MGILDKIGDAIAAGISKVLGMKHNEPATSKSESTSSTEEYSQNGGIPFTVPGSTASPATEKAKFTEQDVNAEGMTTLLGKGGGPSLPKPGALSEAKLVNALSKLIKQGSSEGTGSQTNTTATGENEPTTTGGTSEKTTTKSETSSTQGQESDSSVVQQGLYFTNDSVVVQDFKAKNNTSMGRVISQPYKIKYNNPFK